MLSGNDDAVKHVLSIDSFMARDDSEYRREKMSEYARSSSTSESETTHSYTDESVIDCDLPEMVIFLQNSSCRVVRDIGIDKGALSQHKCLIKKCELDTEARNRVVSISNESKSSSDHDLNEDVSAQCCSKHLMEEGEGGIDAGYNISIHGSTPKTINNNLHWIREVDNNYSHFQLPTRSGCRGEHKSDQLPSIVSSPSTRVIVNNFNTIESSVSSQAKNGCIFHEFDSPKLTISSRVEEAQQYENLESPHEIENMARLESTTSSSGSSLVQHCRVESSSSVVVGSLSGPISCSGPISYSGSTSLRSDSSTTSTRSFAFPTLPTEWNGSPIRMAKADQSQFRKHQRWKYFLCCEF